MPDKGRRIASRQAQIGRRKRRQNRSPGSAPSDGATTAVAENQGDSRIAVQDRDSATPPSQDTKAAAPPRPAAASPRQGPARARADRPMAYNYVGPELRRILILSGILIVILVVLAFFV
jgi:hypothetical protein